MLEYIYTEASPKRKECFITELPVKEKHLPHPDRIVLLSYCPLLSALYMGVSNRDDPDYWTGSYQGTLSYDLATETYTLQTGEAHRIRYTAGPMLHRWITAYMHHYTLCPIRVRFDPNTHIAEIMDMDMQTLTEKLLCI